MPGVPSGRGCDACRKQKKKCDSARYPCSRCRRLNIPCIGLGQQRYKFMNDTQSSDSDSVTPNSPRRARPSSQVSRERSTQASAATPVVFWSLSNDHTRRVGAFVDKIKPSTGVKFNLAWTFGNYLVDVPARLGTNDALDKAADAVLTALERFSFSGTPGQMTPRMLEKYTLALAALRTSLDDSVAAKSCETLCAIMLLLMCQTFLGASAAGYTTHSRGAAQILRLRGHPDKCEPFEKNLLLALRGVVLFESLFNDRAMFTDQEWIDMFEGDSDPNTDKLFPEGRAIQCLTRVPNMMRRAKRALQTANEDPSSASELPLLREEARRLRGDLEPHLSSLRDRVGGVGAPSCASNTAKATVWSDLLDCHHLRTYGLGLGIAIFINEIQLALAQNFASAAHVLDESERFAAEIVHLARGACRYRPLGASALAVCLIAAELGAGDPGTILSARQLRVEYESDFRVPDASSQASLVSDAQLICGRRASCFSNPSSGSGLR